MSWIEVKLKIPETTVEKISAYLFAMGCEGMNVHKNAVTIYFSQQRWNDEKYTAILHYISHFIPAFSEKLFKIKSIKDQN